MPLDIEGQRYYGEESGIIDPHLHRAVSHREYTQEVEVTEQ